MIIREYPLEIIRWDEKYIYFNHMNAFKLRYNVLENKYEIDKFIEVGKNDLEIIK